MHKKNLIMMITVVLLIAAVSAAFAYGKAQTGDSASTKQSALERMDDFDWSRACPAASCRNKNHGETKPVTMDGYELR